jgi:hypothetical protein
MRSRDVLKLALITFVQPELRNRKAKRLAQATRSRSEDAAEISLNGLAGIVEQSPLEPYDADAVLAELRQRDAGWRTYLAEDELMDGKQVASFSLIKDSHDKKPGHYIGTVRHIGRVLGQGYLASAFGVGMLNEQDASGKYQPISLAEAAALIEGRTFPSREEDS